MGYTHYWKQKSVSKNYETEAQKALSEIKRALVTMPTNSQTAGGHYSMHDIILRDGFGDGEPTINNELISFNGDGENGLAHETFLYNFDAKPFKFEFCKTARKPYDQAVCLCLLALANNIEGFEFSSDGDKEDWQPAIDFYLGMEGVQMSDNLKKSLEEILGVTK